MGKIQNMCLYENMCLRHFMCQYILYKYVTCFGKYIVKNVRNCHKIEFFWKKTFWWSSKYKSRSKKFTCPFGLVPMKFLLSDRQITCFGRVGYIEDCKSGIKHHNPLVCSPLANEVAKGYSNATVRPSCCPSILP